VSPPRIRIEPLTREHQRRHFDCGCPAVNSFLARYARQNAEKDISRTYVAVLPGQKHVLGYYTVTASSIAFEDLPPDAGARLPHYPIPTVHLAWLGVHTDVQGQGLGGVLLWDALKLASRFADEIGAYAVTVDAIDADTRGFYLAHGFIPIEEDLLHLYMPMRAIRKLLPDRPHSPGPPA